MQVCLIERCHGKLKFYQIMRKVGCGFNHVSSGKLFTLEQARVECHKQGFQVVAIGDLWECL